MHAVRPVCAQLRRVGIQGEAACVSVVRLVRVTVIMCTQLWVSLSCPRLAENCEGTTDRICVELFMGPLYPGSATGWGEPTVKQDTAHSTSTTCSQVGEDVTAESQALGLREVSCRRSAEQAGERRETEHHGTSVHLCTVCCNHLTTQFFHI